MLSSLNTSSGSQEGNERGCFSSTSVYSGDLRSRDFTSRYLVFSAKHEPEPRAGDTRHASANPCHALGHAAAGSGLAPGTASLHGAAVGPGLLVRTQVLSLNPRAFPIAKRMPHRTTWPIFALGLGEGEGKAAVALGGDDKHPFPPTPYHPISAGGRTTEGNYRVLTSTGALGQLGKARPLSQPTLMLFNMNSNPG